MQRLEFAHDDRFDVSEAGYSLVFEQGLGLVTSEGIQARAGRRCNNRESL